MTTESTPQSGPILDLPTAVRELGALPMPAGNEPKKRTMLDHARAALNARMTKDDLRLVLENTITFAASLEADREANDREYEAATTRIAALEAERHTTNEALSDAAEQLRKNRDQITALETQREWRRAHLVALQNDALNIRGALSPNGEARKVPFELGQTLLPAVEWLIARVSELEAAQGTVYRAAHDSIVMGLYRTATEARAHCVAEERRTWAKHETPVFDWIEDEEDSVAELVIVDEDGDVGSLTGYVVTALEVAAEYDEEADQ